MIHIEDILDDARRYLDGKMNEEERERFEQLLSEHPHLQEELQLLYLVREGLEELEDEGEDGGEDNSSGRSFRFRKTVMLILIGVLLFGLWFCLKQFGLTSKDKDLPGPIRERVSSDDEFRDRERPALQTLGGKSPFMFSDRGWGVAWDSSGYNVFLGGLFAGSVNIGDSRVTGDSLYNDLFLARFNVNGDFQKLKVMGGPGQPESLRNLIVDGAGNLLITGSFEESLPMEDDTLVAMGKGNKYGGEFFVAKLHPSGVTLWTDHFGGIRFNNADINLPGTRYDQTGTNVGNALTVDSGNHVIVCGAYTGNPTLLGFGTLPSGGPNEDLFIAKYSPEGALQWIRTATGTYAIQGRGIAADREGNIYVTGSFGHHNLGGMAFFGSDTLVTRGGTDIFLAKYNASGQLDWVRQAGDTTTINGRDLGMAVAVDPQGNPVITGYFKGNAVFGRDTLKSRGGRDIFLAKYDPAGAVKWVRRAGGDQARRHDAGKDLAVDQTGNIYLTGSFDGPADFSGYPVESRGQQDAFVAKYNLAGDLVWVRTIGGDYEGRQGDSALGIDVNWKGQCVVTGFYAGDLYFQGERKEILSAGREDIFLIVLGPEGNLISIHTGEVFL